MLNSNRIGGRKSVLESLVERPLLAHTLVAIVLMSHLVDEDPRQVVHVLVLVLDDLILGDSTEIDEATGWRLSGRTLVP